MNNNYKSLESLVSVCILTMYVGSGGSGTKETKLREHSNVAMKYGIQTRAVGKRVTFKMMIVKTGKRVTIVIVLTG